MTAKAALISHSRRRPATSTPYQRPFLKKTPLSNSRQDEIDLPAMKMRYERVEQVALTGVCKRRMAVCSVAVKKRLRERRARVVARASQTHIINDTRHSFSHQCA